tara:strand:+ start:60 stop:614 length:555 start_codon:yes stop_codon:yes gene_type:complete
MWLICGLGNPDKKYKFTRHNIGFNFIENLVNYNSLALYKIDNNKELYKGKIEETDCFACKPLTYMNLSGTPIKKIIDFYKIPISKVIIVHDDLDIEFNKIKIKVGGGNGGHNGLLSIDNSIGKNYKRLRIGIGRPSLKEEVSDYVLSNFTKEERLIIDNKIKLLVNNFPLIFKGSNSLLTKLAL